jgi:hypothetical protein
MSRVYNFSAGPAALPLEVLETIRNDIPDWQSTGMSVMEVSHRSKDFVALAERAEANFRELLAIPDSYSVLFVQGGATLQMSMAPMNLAGSDDTVDYVITGSWGKKAAGEARTSRTSRHGNGAAKRRTFILRRTKPLPASSFILCPQATSRSLPTCPARFFPVRSMLVDTVSFTPGHRKISGRLVSRWSLSAMTCWIAHR